MEKIKLPKLECKRCHHVWVPRKVEVRMCPSCKTPWFDKAKKEMEYKTEQSA